MAGDQARLCAKKMNRFSEELVEVVEVNTVVFH
jgi:hypothetical protein